MKFKLYALLLVIAVLITLSGCSAPSLEADALIQPPAAQGDGRDLQQALEEQLGIHFVLRFPRSGEHRSAIVRHDIDLDGVEEALVFYRPSTELTGTSLALLDLDEDNNWSIRYSTAIGMYVDRVIFGDIDGDRQSEIIIGWTSYTGICSLYIYDYSRGELKPIRIAGSEEGFLYDEVVCGDFDGDGREEIVAAQLARRGAPAQAIMLEYVFTSDGTAVAPVAKVPLQPGTVSYSGSADGRITSTTYAMVLYSDRADGQCCYELICFDRSTVTLYTYPLDSTKKPSEFGALDVNEDGLLELADEAFADEDRSLCIFRWYTCSEEQTLECYTVECPYDGLRLLLPDDWYDTVTFSRTETGIIICSLGDFGTVFELGVFSHERWDEVLNSAHRAGHELTILSEDESSVLAVSLGPAADELSVTPDTVMHMLRSA